MIILWTVICLLVVFIAVLLIRAAVFRPKPEPETVPEDVSVDADRVISNLQALVRFRTVSSRDPAEEDDTEFENLVAALPDLYPNVYSACTLLRLPDRALLYRWKGRSGGDPAVLMAHYDVVPVEEANWDRPPFDGVYEDGVLWGRGTLDTKVTFGGILYAADKLISEGFVPESDVYFAFSGQEEVNGPGAAHIVDWFAENGIEPAFVLDEGGAVVEGVFPGVKRPCGLIGIAEKGMMNLSFRINSNGGHASAPAPHTPIGVLSKACVDVESKPFKSHITAPVAKMFDTLGRHSTFIYRLIFSNLWCFKGVLDMICRRSGGELNALMRTTVAFTQAEGSKAANVIPPTASMLANMRLNPEDTQESAMAYIKSVIKNDDIELVNEYGMDPSRISVTDCPGWEKVRAAVAETWRGCIVSPYLMVQCSDSRHYGKISDRVYRFSAMDLTSEERRMIHGNNERIRRDCAARSAEFFVRVMKRC